MLVDSTIADCRASNSFGGGVLARDANVPLEGGSRIERVFVEDHRIVVSEGDDSWLLSCSAEGAGAEPPGTVAAFFDVSWDSAAIASLPSLQV